MAAAAERQSDRAFSLLELLITLVVIAVLLSFFLPMLLAARNSGYTAVCASNLRQMNVGWQGYLQDHKEQFPRYELEPDWRYGGVVTLSRAGTRQVVLDATRPINAYLAAGLDVSVGTAGVGSGSRDRAGDSAELIGLFRCPADAGVYARGGGRGRAGLSVLNGQTCYEYYGNSYRANPRLLDAALADIGTNDHRPLALHDITVDTSRLLLAADSAWYYATAPVASQDAALEASWHPTRDAGNMLAADGSVRFTDFSKKPGAEYTLAPRAD